MFIFYVVFHKIFVEITHYNYYQSVPAFFLSFKHILCLISIFSQSQRDAVFRYVQSNLFRSSFPPSLQSLLSLSLVLSLDIHVMRDAVYISEW